jgi:hypothetical protein
MISREENLNWVESLFNRIPLPYPIVSLIIIALLYLIYAFVRYMIDKDWQHMFAHSLAYFMCITIAYQFGGIQYLINIMKKIFFYWSSLFRETDDDDRIKYKERFMGSNLYFVLVFFIIVPFYLIDWIPPIGRDLKTHFLELYLSVYSSPPFHNIWGLLFDIYAQTLGFLMLFLLAIIIWIMINIIWTLRGPNCIYSNCIPKINVFSTKMRIISIRTLILKVITYYFICISLIIVSYMNPKSWLNLISPLNFMFNLNTTELYNKEIFILLILLLVGIIFFILGLNSIQRVLKCQVEFELEKINKMDQEQLQILTSIASREDHSSNAQDITRIINVLDAFQKQREQMEKIDTNIFGFNSIVRFIGTFLLPIISGILNKNSDIINKIINDLASYFK